MRGVIKSIQELDSNIIFMQESLLVNLASEKELMSVCERVWT